MNMFNDLKNRYEAYIYIFRTVYFENFDFHFNKYLQIISYPVVVRKPDLDPMPLNHQ